MWLFEYSSPNIDIQDMQYFYLAAWSDVDKTSSILDFFLPPVSIFLSIFHTSPPKECPKSHLILL